MNETTEPDPLAEWCAREMKLNIDGNDLIIKPTMEHYRKLRALSKAKPEEAEETAKKQKEILKEILKTTFPNSVSVDDFLERYETKFSIAILAEIIGIPPEELKKKFTQALNEKS